MNVEHIFTDDYAVRIEVEPDKRFMSLVAKSGSDYPDTVEVRLDKQELKQLLVTLAMALDSM